MSGYAGALLDHLWQTTLVWLAVWALCERLRGASAALRFRLWLAASLKFVVPFALVRGAGTLLRVFCQRWHAPVAPHNAMSRALGHAASPFAHSSWVWHAQAVAPSPASAGHGAWTGWLAATWLAGTAALALRYGRATLRMRALVRAARPVGFADGVPVFTCATRVGPAAVGLLQPRIVLPDSFLQQFPESQLRAIVAHELAHVRRRDNLLAVFYTAVVALWWFHPAAWMMRRRLLEERELACDAEVVRAGNSREAYAEGLLGVCRWYLEAECAHAAGVAGGNLKKRVRQILDGVARVPLGLSGRLLLVASGVLVMGLALAPGLFSDAVPDSSLSGLPRYSVVSVKPTQKTFGYCFFVNDGFHCESSSLKDLIEAAYHIDKSYQVDRMPDWAGRSYYAVEAKVDADDIARLNALGYARRAGMMAPVLAERFHLRTHWETRTLPVYLLEVAKGGSRLHPPAKNDATRHPAVGQAFSGDGAVTMGLNGQAIGIDVPVSMVVQTLSGYTDRAIVDRTHLREKYDFTVQLPRPQAHPDGGVTLGFGGESMHSAEQTAEADPTASATLFTAVADLGLRLEAARLAMPVLVIDSVERPTGN